MSKHKVYKKRARFINFCLCRNHFVLVRNFYKNSNPILSFTNSNRINSHEFNLCVSYYCNSFFWLGTTFIFIIIYSLVFCNRTILSLFRIKRSPTWLFNDVDCVIQLLSLKEGMHMVKECDQLQWSIPKGHYDGHFVPGLAVGRTIWSAQFYRRFEAALHFSQVGDVQIDF